VRKNLWQQAARRDPDYKENQARAQAKWCANHPDYWRSYRENHPEYVKNNRDKQTVRNAKRRKKKDCKERT